MELEAGGVGGATSEVRSVTPPRVRDWFSNVETVIATEGAALLENPAEHAAWQAFAVRHNLVVQRGLPGLNGERSFAFLPCRAAETPQARPAPDPATLPPEGIGLTGGAWVVVQAMPRGEGRFVYAYSRMRTAAAPRPSPVNLPTMEPGEDPAAFFGRVRAYTEQRDEANLQRALRAGEEP